MKINETHIFPEALRLMKFRHSLERYLRRNFNLLPGDDENYDDLIKELESIETELYKI